MADEIPQDQVVLDTPAPTQNTDIPQDQVVPDEIPQDQVTIDQPEDKYSTPGQQLGTVAEGLAQGVAGPLATGAELGLSKLGVPGMSAEDIAGRAEANPAEHGLAEAAGIAGSLMTGVGEAGLIAKGAKAVLPEALPILGEFGSAAVKGAIEAGLIQGGDEASKAMLGQGDPEHPVSAALTNMGASALLGGVTGGLFNIVGKTATASSKVLASIDDSKMATNMKNISAGVGAASKGVPLEEAKAMNTIYDPFLHKEIIDPDFNSTLFKMGHDLYNKGISAVSRYSTDAVAGAVGGAAGSIAGPVGTTLGTLSGAKAADAYLTPMVEKLTKRAANKMLVPAVMKMLGEGNADGLSQVIDYTRRISKGLQQQNNAIESIFKGTGQQILNTANTERDRDKLKDYIDQGGIDQQMQNENQGQPQTPQFAEGGKVPPPKPEQSSDPIAKNWPNQASMLMAAKSRISNYLKATKPQPPANKLPYDEAFKDQDAERHYNKAIDIANQPLSIIEHVRNGTLLPDHMKHFISMYPEIHNNLRGKISKRMLEQQLKEEKLPYKVRQSLSMFLGTPLDSSMTQASIAAAQPAPQQPQQPQPTQKPKKTKSKTNLNKLPSDYRTPEQAAEVDKTDRR